tara:strand:- start:238741 stop:239049 length:309 start_codon:yes stop_codon:yes gene_type:complete
MQRFDSLKDFYPFYLSQHQHPINRMLHFVATSLVIFVALYTLFSQAWWYLLLMPLFGYSFAWIGHFFFERNKPATFQYPLYSLASDFIMFKDILFGKIKLNT